MVYLYLKCIHLMAGSGSPTASQGRNASELDSTVKLAALPPSILGLLCIFLAVERSAPTVVTVVGYSCSAVMMANVSKVTAIPELLLVVGLIGMAVG